MVLRMFSWREWRGLGLLSIAAAAALALLAACGGGASQIVAFKPNRLIVLGDEVSVIVNDGANNGKKYGVNGLNESSVRDCLLLPNWVQSVASLYTFVFAECNAAAATPKAFMRAKAGAKVEDATRGIAAQVAEQVAAGGALTAKDLVTVLIGTNDLAEIADRVQAGTLSANDALTEVRRRGGVLAARINAILATGAKVIVSTTPDIGLSPYALALNAASPGAAARLSSWIYEYNASMRIGIDSSKYDGRDYGLVLADDIVQAIAKNPGSLAFANVTLAACVVAQPNCTGAAADLVEAAAASTYLWASDRWLTPAAQTRIGASAVSRAQNNPF